MNNKIINSIKSARDYFRTLRQEAGRREYENKYCDLDRILRFGVLALYWLTAILTPFVYAIHLHQTAVVEEIHEYFHKLPANGKSELLEAVKAKRQEQLAQPSNKSIAIPANTYNEGTLQ